MCCVRSEPLPALVVSLSSRTVPSDPRYRAVCYCPFGSYIHTMRYAPVVWCGAALLTCSCSSSSISSSSSWGAAVGVRPPEQQLSTFRHAQLAVVPHWASSVHPGRVRQNQVRASSDPPSRLIRSVHLVEIQANNANITSQQCQHGHRISHTFSRDGHIGTATATRQQISCFSG